MLLTKTSTLKNKNLIPFIKFKNYLHDRENGEKSRGKGQEKTKKKGKRKEKKVRA